ncbi:hypothetical protein BGX28_000640, partial [Mortierella sp. GBA30]
TIGVLTNFANFYPRMASRALLNFFAWPPPAGYNISNLERFTSDWSTFGTDATRRDNYIYGLCNYLMRHFAGIPVAAPRAGQAPAEYRAIATTILNMFNDNPTVYTQSHIPASNRIAYNWVYFFDWLGNTFVLEIQSNMIWMMIPDHSNHGQAISVPRASQNSSQYRNLTIKRAALYQAMFKFRRDLESRKDDLVLLAEASILPRRGVNNQGTIAFLQSLNAYEQDNCSFYNDGYWFRSMRFDLKRAMEGELGNAIKAVIDMIGTCDGTGIFHSANPPDVLVSIGIGEFGANYKLTNLHGTYKRKLLQKCNLTPSGLSLYFAGVRILYDF